MDLRGYSQEEQKTCCCFFSIETGVKIIFVITLIDMFLQLLAMFVEGLWAEYLPIFFLNSIFITLFLIPKCDRTMDTVTHRTRTAWYYFFCIAILGHIWIVIGLTGLGADELKKICITNGIAEKWYNGDNLKCRDEQRIVLIVNVFINMLF